MDARVEDGGFHNMLTVSDIMVYFDHCKKVPCSTSLSVALGGRDNSIFEIACLKASGAETYGLLIQDSIEYRCAYEQGKLKSVVLKIVALRSGPLHWCTMGECQPLICHCAV